MISRTIDWVFAGGTVLLGCYILSEAIDYGYWQSGRPGPGFFPLLVSLGIIILGAINCIRAISGKEQLSSEINPKDIIKPALIATMIALFIWISHYFGMVIVSGLLVLSTGLLIREKRDKLFLKRIILVAILFPIFGYFLFSYYLGVPLEQGLWGI